MMVFEGAGNLVSPTSNPVGGGLSWVSLGEMLVVMDGSRESPLGSLMDRVGLTLGLELPLVGYREIEGHLGCRGKIRNRSKWAKTYQFFLHKERKPCYSLYSFLINILDIKGRLMEKCDRFLLVVES